MFHNMNKFLISVHSSQVMSSKLCTYLYFLVTELEARKFKISHMHNLRNVK